MQPLELHADRGGDSQQEPFLSKGVQKVLDIALREALAYQQREVTTGDLLIGLLQVEPTRTALESVGVTVEGVRKVRQVFGDYRNPIDVTSSSPTLPIIDRWFLLPRTLRMRKIGSLVAKRVRENNGSVAEVKDVLIVIIEEGQGTAARVLKHMGMDTKKLVKEVLAVISV